MIARQSRLGPRTVAAASRPPVWLPRRQDRFFAHHSAIAYYWVLVALWILSPNLAYRRPRRKLQSRTTSSFHGISTSRPRRRRDPFPVDTHCHLARARRYTFSELIEAHAVDTYAQFADENREALAKLPAPEVIRNYYEGDPLFASYAG